MFDPMTTYQLAYEHHRTLLQEADRGRLLQLIRLFRHRHSQSKTTKQAPPAACESLKREPSATY